MKMWRGFIWIAGALIAIVFASQAGVAQEEPRSFPQIALRDLAEETCDAELLSSFWVPPGTESWYEGRTLRFKVPSGYVVWNLSKDGTYLPLEAGGVECSCEGGGCDPVSQGGQIGCLIKPACSSGCCKRTTTSAEVTVLVTEALGSVRRATPQEVKSLPLAPPQLADIPEIAEAIKTFVDRAYAGRERAVLETKGNRAWAPKGHKLVAVNVYGYLANVLLPASTKCEELLASSSSNKCLDDGGEAAKCRCNAGTGCTYWSKPLVGVSGCDSGSCSRCEMLTN